MDKSSIRKKSIDILSKYKRATIVADVGVGKSWIILQKVQDIVRTMKDSNIGIILPKKTIKNFLKEIEVFGLVFDKTVKKADNYYILYHIESKSVVHITTITNLPKITNPFIVLIDEIHEILTPKKIDLLKESIKHNNDKMFYGLTATADDDKPLKKQYYTETCPIVWRYTKAEKDKITNSKKIFVVKYDLTNEYKFKLEKFSRHWEMGEKDAYDYINNLIETSQEALKRAYWNEVSSRLLYLAGIDKFQTDPKYLPYTVKDKYKNTFIKLASKDLTIFKRYKKSIMSYFSKLWDNKQSTSPDPVLLQELSNKLGFYWMLRFIIGTDYAIFGIDHYKVMNKVPSKLKKHSFDYNWAVRERIRLLNSLTSSAIIAKQLKRKILETEGNRVIIFSKLSSQIDRITPYTVHSNNSNEVNKTTLEKFNKEEINEIGTVNMLGTGINFKKLNNAIKETFDSSKVKNVQNTGRLTRLNVDEIANVYYIVPKNTQTEVWFDNLNLKDVNLI